MNTEKLLDCANEEIEMLKLHIKTLQAEKCSRCGKKSDDPEEKYGRDNSKFECKTCDNIGTVKMDTMGLGICEPCWFKKFINPILKSRNSGICEMCCEGVAVGGIDVAHDEDRSACRLCMWKFNNNRMEYRQKTVIKMLENIRCYKSDKIKKEKLLKKLGKN